MLIRNLSVVFISVVLVMFQTEAGELDPENTIILELQGGNVVIQMLPDLAPRHVKRIKELARENFYDGAPFHRVIEGFMAQTGDPTGTGMGGSGIKLEAEFPKIVSGLNFLIIFTPL